MKLDDSIIDQFNLDPEKEKDENPDKSACL